MPGPGTTRQCSSCRCCSCLHAAAGLKHPLWNAAWVVPAATATARQLHTQDMVTPHPLAGESSPGPAVPQLRTCSVILRTSGCAVIIWSLGGSSMLPLYLRSPMALLRLRLPFTRHTPPISLKKPPVEGQGRQGTAATCGTHGKPSPAIPRPMNGGQGGKAAAQAAAMPITGKGAGMWLPHCMHAQGVLRALPAGCCCAVLSLINAYACIALPPGVAVPGVEGRRQSGSVD